VVVTCTSTQRPELLLRTFESWQENLQGVAWSRLIINFDPNPTGNHLEECYEICNRFFSEVDCRVAATGSFGQAIKWIWGQVENETVLHLEDDWLLNFKIAAGELVGLLRAFPQVAFRAYNRSKYEKFVLAPSFIRGETCREIASEIDTSTNPEQWIRKQGKWNQTYVYPEFPADKILVEDIGRAYNQSNGIGRNGAGEEAFTSYVAGRSESLINQAAGARAARAKYGRE
jgi:hypothetical protein